MLCLLFVGVVLLDDLNVRVLFDVFVCCDGVVCDEEIDENVCDVDLDVLVLWLKFVVLNVGVMLMMFGVELDDVDDCLKVFVLGGGLNGCVVVSDGGGGAFVGRLGDGVRDGVDDDVIVWKILSENVEMLMSLIVVDDWCGEYCVIGVMG